MDNVTGQYYSRLVSIVTESITSYWDFGVWIQDSTCATRDVSRNQTGAASSPRALLATCRAPPKIKQHVSCTVCIEFCRVASAVSEVYDMHRDSQLILHGRENALSNGRMWMMEELAPWGSGGGGFPGFRAVSQYY